MLFFKLLIFLMTLRFPSAKVFFWARAVFTYVKTARTGLTENTQDINHVVKRLFYSLSKEFQAQRIRPWRGYSLSIQGTCTVGRVPGMPRQWAPRENLRSSTSSAASLECVATRGHLPRTSPLTNLQQCKISDVGPEVVRIFFKYKDNSWPH